MKKTIATAILMAASSLVFADETTAMSLSTTDLPKEKITTVEKISPSSKSFTYLKMGAMDTYPTDTVQIVPGLGLGYRLNTGDGAVDFSANYTRGTGLNGKEVTYFYTFPKVSYLHYLSPSKSQSLYVGAGLAFGSLKNKEMAKFIGLIPSATLGYEMNRKANFRSFLQLDVSQPAVAAKLTRNDGVKFPGPVAEFSLGVGF